MTRNHVACVRAWALLVATVAASSCQLDRPGVALTQPDADEAEEVADAAPLPDALTCDDWRATHFDPCAIAEPAGDLVLDQQGIYRYDTDTGMLLDPRGAQVPHVSQELPQEGGPTVRLVIANRVEIGPLSVLRAQGDLPLVIGSWSAIEVSGTIDVSSNADGAGAGAEPAACDEHDAGNDENRNGGGAGGGGGGFGGNGGRGGDGDSDAVFNSDSDGGDGGSAVPVPQVVRGGCRGGRGGNGRGGDGGPAGAGGGAVQLTAAREISIAGIVHAGGAGGNPPGPGSDAGGGGGGSGGNIGLDAPVVKLLAADTVLAANGGGGGPGASNNDGTNPPMDRGGDGRPNAESAPGGSLGCCGSVSGAPGSGGGSREGVSVSTTPKGGGGGAGGGAGYIVVASPSVSTAGGAVVCPEMSRE